MMNSKGNVIQAHYSVKTSKVRINSEEQVDVPLYFDKLEIKVDRPTEKLQLDNFTDGLKTMLVKRYEGQLASLKLNELIVIDLSMLFFDESVVGALMNLIIASFTECLLNKCNLNPSNGHALLALTIKGFYVKEKDAMLWLFDPNKSELINGHDVLKSCIYGCIVDMQSGKLKLVKESGCSVSYGDIVNLTQLIKGMSFTTDYQEMNGFYSNRERKSFTLFN